MAVLIFFIFRNYNSFFILKADVLFDESIYAEETKNITDLQSDLNKKEYESLIKEKDSLNILNYEGQVKFLLKEVEKITNDSGLTLNSINFNSKINASESKTEDDSVKFIMFNVNISGTYLALKNWLVKIHEIKIASINRINFSILDDQKIDSQVELKMYYK